MVFKDQTVRERLKHLQESLDKLEQLRASPKEELLSQFEKYWAAEHGLHLAAETIFDIGNHILAGKFGENPRGYDEIIPKLAEKGVITQALAKRFEKVGGFRNILVHEYMTVDKEKVYDRLQEGLGDFHQFIKEILLWLEKV